MSLGGFKAVVKIVRSQFGCGLGDKGVPISKASMELEGRLIELNYGNLNGDKLLFNKKTKVSIDIEFTEKQEIDEGISTDEKQYIGSIHYDKNEKPMFDSEEKIVVRIGMTLVYHAFSQLFPMEGRDIVVETIHDIVVNPDSRQKQDHIVALIKRAYFEVI